MKSIIKGCTSTGAVCYSIHLVHGVDRYVFVKQTPLEIIPASSGKVYTSWEEFASHYPTFYEAIKKGQDT